MTKRHLVVTLLVFAACGKKSGADLAGTWEADCAYDDGTSVETKPTKCTLTIGAKQGTITPIHISAPALNLDCDGEAPSSKDKKLTVAAPKACNTSIGSKLAQYSIWPADGGKLGFVGDFSGETTPFKLRGELTRGSAKPAAKSAAASGGAPGGGGAAAPAPSAPPPSAPPAAPPTP